MQKAFLLILLLTLCSKGALAQGKLMLYPNSIEFTDPFHRLNNIYFINNGDSSITIQDISYNSDAYFVRFDKSWYYPIILPPGDTLMMDCILQSYYQILPTDTSDTMSVYSGDNKLLAKLSIKIDYFYAFFKGAIEGHISDGIKPISGAKVFFYNSNLIVQTAITDNSGYYFAQLPPGGYKVSAQKDSFYVTYYGQQPSPYNAEPIYIKSDSVKTADIVLNKMGNSGISISGHVYDSPVNIMLRRGIVVVHPGTHTPSKISANAGGDISQSNVYSAIIKYDGSYKIENISQPGYYYVQAISDYYVPSYFNSSTKPAIFWQKADSVLINNSPQEINIFMPRDSAFGNGNISGKILLNNSSDTSSPGAIIMVQSLERDSSILAYAFTDINGNFTVSNLQYGKYLLRAQKFGYADIYSEMISIDSSKTSVDGIEMNFNITGIKGTPAVPAEFQLFQNYPNPFNPSTTIGYYLPYSTKVLLRIINVLGQEVSVLSNGYASAGSHKALFNGTKLASGIYFVNLIAGGKSINKKIVLLK
jgi:hypothetical protein